MPRADAAAFKSHVDSIMMTPAWIVNPGGPVYDELECPHCGATFLVWPEEYARRTVGLTLCPCMYCFMPCRRYGLTREQAEAIVRRRWTVYGT